MKTDPINSTLDHLSIPDSVTMAVLLGGFSSMSMEVVASRILTPYFGSSVYVWGSILSVFMVCLSLGYYIGGIKASEAGKRQLKAALLISSIYLLLIALLDASLLSWYTSTFNLGIYSYLIPVAFLFGPPITLIGFISPYAAEISDEESTGRASGHVYAAGTLGSIFGAVLTTFLLLPLLELQKIQLLIAVVLAGASLNLGENLRISEDISIGIILVIGVITLQPAATPLNEYPQIVQDVEEQDQDFERQNNSLNRSEVIHKEQTIYQSLKIVENGELRTLYLSGNPQSAMNLTSPHTYAWDYPRNFHLSMLPQRDVEKVLFIGGGGFSAPKRFDREYNVSIDVVEIDPGVVDAAEEYFMAEETQDMSIHVEDGRRFLENTEKNYDVIILDAYRGDRIPFHLTTREFFKLAKRKMKEDGVLMTNILSHRYGEDSLLYRSHFETVKSVFPEVYSLPNAGEGYQLIQIFAMKNPVSRERLVDATAEEINKSGFNLTEEVRRLRQPQFTEAKIFKDDMGTARLPSGVASERLR